MCGIPLAEHRDMKNRENLVLQIMTENYNKLSINDVTSENKITN